MEKTKKQSCPDCGNAPVNHWVEKTMITLEWLLSPINRFLDAIWRTIEPAVNPITNKVLPPFLKVLLFLHLGVRRNEPNEKTGGRARCFWEEAKRRGIDMWEFSLFGMSKELFVATWKGRTITFDGLPRPGGKSTESLLWMDNKNIMKQKFRKAGIPVAKGGVACSYRGALKIFKGLTPPVIAKPHEGSRSRHTTIHIETPEELRIAFQKANQLSPFVIIEEELVGMVHRGTLIGGRVIGILRREPACVTGDGIHTVQELIEIENLRPERKGPIFHKIAIHDPEHDKELAREGLSLGAIPAKDRVVTLSQKASRGLGGGATDVTDTAHPDNTAMLESIGSLMCDGIIGVDFIIDDVTKSWKEQPHSGVIECNSLPFIDLHLHPLVGKVRDTAGALWDLVFPGSKK